MTGPVGGSEAMVAPQPRWRRAMRMLGPVSLVAVVTAGVSRWWVDRSRDAPSWDVASYHNRVVDLVHILGHHPFDALHQMGYSVFHSVSFTDLFAVPMIPLVAIAGNSRSTYIELSTVLGMGAFALLVGGLVRELVPERPQLGRWCGIGAALVAAPMWQCVLAGWPDLFVADLLVAVMLLWGRDPGLGRIRTRLGIPIALAACIMLRRYALSEVLAVLAVLAAASLLGVGRGQQPRTAASPRPRTWARLASRPLGRVATAALPVVGTLLLLVVFSPGYFREFHNIRADGLYVSYESGPRAIFDDFVRAWGVVTLLVAVAGLAARAVVARRAGRSVFLVAGVAGQGLGALAGWTFFGRQYEVHYMTQIGLAVTAGVALAAATLLAAAVPARSSAGVDRAWLADARMAGLALLMVVVATVPHFGAGHENTVLGQRLRPPVRTDFAALESMVDHLRALAPRGPVLVASSGELNSSLLANLERDRFGPAGVRVRFVQEPQVDSADRWPDQAIFSADLVVLADPVPLDLPVDQQGVVTSVEALFRARRGAATDFHRLPGGYDIQGGVQVTMYERWRPTSLARAEATLAFVRQATIHRPGRQPAWDVLGPDPAVDLSEGAPGGVLTGSVGVPSARQPVTFFTVDPVGDGTRLALHLDGGTGCEGRRLEAEWLTTHPSGAISGGSVAEPGDLALTIGDDGPGSSLLPDGSAPRSLALQLTAPGARVSGCRMSFRLDRSAAG